MSTKHRKKRATPRIATAKETCSLCGEKVEAYYMTRREAADEHPGAIICVGTFLSHPMKK